MFKPTKDAFHTPYFKRNIIKFKELRTALNFEQVNGIYLSKWNLLEEISIECAMKLHFQAYVSKCIQ